MHRGRKMHDLFRSLTEVEVQDIDSMISQVMARTAAASLYAACKGDASTMLLSISGFLHLPDGVEEILDAAAEAIEGLDQNVETEAGCADAGDLGTALEALTNPLHPDYDPDFDKEIRDLRPDWFSNDESKGDEEE